MRGRFRDDSFGDRFGRGFRYGLGRGCNLWYGLGGGDSNRQRSSLKCRDFAGQGSGCAGCRVGCRVRGGRIDRCQRVACRQSVCLGFGQGFVTADIHRQRICRLRPGPRPVGKIRRSLGQGGGHRLGVLHVGKHLVVNGRNIAVDRLNRTGFNLGLAIAGQKERRPAGDQGKKQQQKRHQHHEDHARAVAGRGGGAECSARTCGGSDGGRASGGCDIHCAGLAFGF